MNDQFYGKYRGSVTDNQDPDNLGRIKATVPDVLGEQESGWAMPCLPFAGDKIGFFALPAVRASVWIEFEHGDPDYPIWSGCWWGENEIPSDWQERPHEKLLIKTVGGHKLLLDDTSGSASITIEASGGQKIVISSQGIEINNGKGAKITLNNSTVSINDSALEVT